MNLILATGEKEQFPLSRDSRSSFPGHSAGLGQSWFGNLRSAVGEDPDWAQSISKDITLLDHGRMTLVMRQSDILYYERIGKGIHRPYKLRISTGLSAGCITATKGVMKTLYCQYETKRYCDSMDARVSGPEREILAYDLDKALGFNLVPPTIGRFVDGIGFGSVQGWVTAPLAIDWLKKAKWDYKKHPENPWFHRIAAFDFITGQIDRHAANWLLDERGRVYAIDNGYSFVKGDDRRFLKCNVGKALVGRRIHPLVREEIAKIDSSFVAELLKGRGFQCGEEAGVLKRLDEIKKMSVWRVLGGYWETAEDTAKKKQKKKRAKR